MNSIVIFGAGNVATHLFRAINKTKDFKVVQVYNHSPGSLSPFKDLVPTTTQLDEVVPATIYLLALKDEAIPVTAKKILYRDALVLHTSGGTSLDVLSDFDKRGVLYPLQTFSKNKEVNFEEVPLCIEAGEPSQLLLLEKLAGALSNKIFHISSDQRKSLHVSAVFVCNFVNHLYTMGEEICNKNGVPFEILQPLIKETAFKVTSLTPKEAQTGPAIRNDREVIQAHLQLLNEHQQEIYSLLTQSIQDLHGKKL